jgi:putative endonuclease
MHSFQSFSRNKLQYALIELGSMKAKWKWYVDIIECLNGRYYTGMTWNIPSRMEQHSSQLGSKYTKKHGYKRLAYYEEFEDLDGAQMREVQIKNWSQEKKKKAHFR